jgi:hypothetical protein
LQELAMAADACRPGGKAPFLPERTESGWTSFLGGLAASNTEGKAEFDLLLEVLWCGPPKVR